MSSNAAPIHFAGSQFPAQRHVCAFFHSSEEKYRVLLPFVKDGFDGGDRASHVEDPDILRPHPMVILGGTLQENPFFVLTDEFSPELREKRVGQNQ